MTDIMLDLETTGTLPDYHAIIQIAAVKFNYETEEIGSVFNRCLSVAPMRHWDEETRIWWSKMPAVLNGIISKMESPEVVLREFSEFACEGAPDQGYRMWAKPTHFEFPFVASYCRQFAVAMPFHYRQARDLNTFIAARAGGAGHVEMDHIDMVGSAHNALSDAIHQLKMLFSAKHGNFGILDAEFEDIT